MVALDEEGCPKYREEDEIVVCGTPEDEKSQRIFERDTDENRLRRGESASSKRAAACITGDTMCKIPLPATVGVGFGYVPPYMTPLSEIMEGLPEQGMVVPEGSSPSAPANPD